MFGYIVVATLLQLLAVGALAQRWKGRTGVFWSLATLGLNTALLWLVGDTFDPEMRALRGRPPISEFAGDLATAIGVLGISTVVMLGAIATLPTPKRVVAEEGYVEDSGSTGKVVWTVIGLIVAALLGLWLLGRSLP